MENFQFQDGVLDSLFFSLARVNSIVFFLGMRRKIKSLKSQATSHNSQPMRVKEVAFSLSLGDDLYCCLGDFFFFKEYFSPTFFFWENG
jgi:hypothetical protein